jgi:hypothetical protein
MKSSQEYIAARARRRKATIIVGDRHVLLRFAVVPKFGRDFDQEGLHDLFDEHTITVQIRLH